MSGGSEEGAAVGQGAGIVSAVVGMLPASLGTVDREGMIVVAADTAAGRLEEAGLLTVTHREELHYLDKAAHRAVDTVLQGMQSRGHRVDERRLFGVDSHVAVIVGHVAVVLGGRTGHCRERVVAVAGSLMGDLV